MNKFYINNDKGRKYYTYSFENGHIKLMPLNEKDTEVFLSHITSKPIEQIISKENYKEIIFGGNTSLIIEKLRDLYPKQDKYDKYFLILLKKAREFVTRENIRSYKKTLPPNHIPKVNRTKKSKLPAKQIIAGALSFSIGISLIAGLVNQEINKEKFVDLNPTISYTVPKTSPIALEKKSNISIDTVINLAFPDRTESNRVSEELSKLEETREYFGDSISYYSERYGIPYDIACAQVTQERPNIKDGVCINPCQITYEYFIGETMTVPVYDESGFTGNYDTFEVTEEMLNSKDGNIKVGLAYTRYCIDKFDSLIMGLFAYNQGDSALRIACNHYGVDIEDYLGEENAIKARDIINRYYEDKEKTHGDAEYLENVFSYLDLSDRGSITLKYYVNGVEKTMEINNTLIYNNELSR